MLFVCNETSTTDIYTYLHTLSLHDALPICEKVESGADPIDAVRDVLPQLRGAFALAILFRSQPDLLIGARLGSPLVVGVGEGETYLGSDALALASLTQRVIYLEEADWVVCCRDKAQIYAQATPPVERATTQPEVAP